MDYTLKWYFGSVGFKLNILLKLISSISFYFFNMAARKFKVNLVDLLFWTELYICESREYVSTKWKY